MHHLITDNLDVWASAELPQKSGGRGRAANSNKSPHGIQKLRELILELAVRGKLVPQDPSDEPATVLLEKVAAEKNKRLKEGKIRKQAPLPSIKGEEQPFELPRGWEWAKLGHLIEMYNGRAFKSTEWSDLGLPIIRIQNLNDETAPFNYFDGELADVHKITDGTLLISWSGTPGTSFGAFVWKRGGAALNQHINKCEVFLEELNIEYLRLAINSCMGHLISMAQGGVGLKHVTKGTLNNIVFGLPPLEEQSRIVTKVDELMALCDRLEQEQTENSEAHQTLVETLLATLTQTEDEEAFAAAWRRIADHFDTLFTTEQSIDQLKQTILQLAVMGKLVPQNPNDEPASELLKKIATEKNQNATFEIPEGWAWTQLSSLADINGGFAFKSADYVEAGTRVIRISDFDEAGFKDDKIVRHTFSPDLSKFSLEENNILMAMTGGTVGKSYFVKSLPEPMVVNQRVATIKISDRAIPSYIDIVIRSEMTQEVIRNAKNSTNDNISMGDIKGFAIPLAPLDEQYRIVAKVEELMAICDELKAWLQEAQTTQIHLADAIVEQAVSG